MFHTQSSTLKGVANRQAVTQDSNKEDEILLPLSPEMVTKYGRAGEMERAGREMRRVTTPQRVPKRAQITTPILVV